VITTPNDGFVKSHEEMLSLLASAVPGAKIIAERIPRSKYSSRENAGRFIVTLERVGFNPLSQSDVYALPCAEDQMIQRAKTLVQIALDATKV